MIYNQIFKNTLKRVLFSCPDGGGQYMTYREYFGTFEKYQEAEAKCALEYHRNELEHWNERVSFYFVRCNKPMDEIDAMKAKTEKTVRMLEELLASKGRIKNPLCLYKWRKLADKECSPRAYEYCKEL